MHQISLFELLREVVLSWQVIAVTLAILIYISIILHVSKKYHKPRVKKVKAPKKKQAPAPVPENEDDVIHDDSNDELGLEEA